MDISVLPILSLIIFSPIVGIALAAIFRDEGNGIPAKVSALFSSGISFLLSLHLWFNFDSSTADLQMVERIPWITQFNIEYFLGLDGLNLFFFLYYNLHHSTCTARFMECREEQLAVPNSNAAPANRNARLFCGNGCSVVLCIF
jgi:NADH:ubiquinone oxidoreductase subunit 4 (chain M)